MSDGEKDATRDHRRAPDTGDADFLTANAQPLRGAAPWERFTAPAADDELSRWSAATLTRAETPDRPEDPRPGSHNDGVLSVADLIAKLGATLPDRPTNHHVADEPEADDDEPEAAADPGIAERDELLDTQVIPTPAYSLQLLSEIPDLGAANYPEDAGTDKQSRRRRNRAAAPAGASAAPEKRKSRRRPILIAGRSMVAVIALLSLVLTGGAWHWSSSKNNQLNTVSALDPGRPTSWTRMRSTATRTS